MNRFRLSTGILSPINSDISLNDTSAFSFDSLSSAPDIEKETESLKFELSSKSSDIESVCKKTMKESASAFDVIVNDIKKQSNINLEREEKFKESYEMLKNSMDELFYKTSHFSIISPVSSSVDLENEDQEGKASAESKPLDTPQIPKKYKTLKKTGFHVLPKHSEISNRKSKRNETCFTKKEENIPKVLAKFSKEPKQSEIHIKNEVEESNLVISKFSKMVSSSTQTCESFESMKIKAKDNLKKFYSQKQRNAVLLSSVPAVENKDLSIEKSVEITVGLEMDNLRRFILEQNLCLRRDLQKIQETVKQQKEVTNYLFSVIEALIKENRKIISKS